MNALQELGNQLDPKAVAAVNITTGIATLLKWIPPVAGAISSLAGLLVIAGVLKAQKLKREKDKIDTEISRITLARLKNDQYNDRI